MAFRAWWMIRRADVLRFGNMMMTLREGMQLMTTEILLLGPWAGVEEKLGQDFVVHHGWEQADLETFLHQNGNNIRGVLTHSGLMQLNAAFFKQLPRLEIIANLSVGFESIDMEAAQARGIVVTNSAGANTEDVAELAFGLILDVGRRISVADRAVRAGKKRDDLPVMHRVSGKTLGLVGLGHIGKAIAKRAEAFSMPVCYTSRSVSADVSYQYVADLETLARKADFLVVTVPGGDETHHIVNRTVLEALGPKGVLINIARGSVVDEPALIRALIDGRLGGAGLDVFETEPDISPEFFPLDNVVLQPHLGGVTQEGLEAVTNLAVRNVQAHFAGRPVLTPVD